MNVFLQSLAHEKAFHVFIFNRPIIKSLKLLRFSPTQKKSHLHVFSPIQMKNFPPYMLLLEPTRLLNLKKNSSLPFY